MSIPEKTELWKIANETIVHRWEKEDWGAVQAALGAGRPLLLRGEPGTGKTQIAEAAAAELNRRLLRITADSRTESRDLLWSFDPVARLAAAQLMSALGVVPEEGSSAEEKVAKRRKLPVELAVERFVRPGPLWWGLNWESALAQERKYSGFEEEVGDENSGEAAGNPACPYEQRRGVGGTGGDDGVLLLIDELDKAPVDVPNGLLEVLGSWRFGGVPGVGGIELKEGGSVPLIVITTNEDRPLSDAFLRRCVVHEVKFPGLEELVARGAAHFSQISKPVLKQAAEWLMEDREKAISGGTLKPGLAEYLDLLRAVQEKAPEWTAEDLRRYFLQKSLGRQQ